MPEVETKAPEKVEPPAPTQKKSAFEMATLAWLLLLGVAVAGTVYYVPSHAGMFGKPVAGPVRMSIVFALGAGAATLFLLRKVFANRLAWYKPGQGPWARGVAYTATIGMGMFAAVSLWRWLFHELGDESRWMVVLTTLPVPETLGGPWKIRPILFPSALVVLAAGAGTHLLYGKPAWADFLIETESELRKVSWPPRNEWIGSSIVVIFVVATVACFLWASDELLSWIMKKVNLGF